MRLERIPDRSPSSEGEASPVHRASVMARRAGSARAAWSAARRSKESSVSIDSIVTELDSEVNFLHWMYAWCSPGRYPQLRSRTAAQLTAGRSSLWGFDAPLVLRCLTLVKTGCIRVSVAIVLRHR